MGGEISAFTETRRRKRERRDVKGMELDFGEEVIGGVPEFGLPDMGGRADVVDGKIKGL